MSSRIQFGLFEFDRATGELLREGRPVRLQPQPARVLALFLARPGEVISRDDLRREVWSEGTFVDFERGLNFCIAQIRSALGDSADSPRYIETLPKRGYRFIAPVRGVSADAGVRPLGEGSDPLPRGQTPPDRRLASRQRVAAAALAAGAILVVVGLLAARPDSDPRIRVAVVPFDNETSEPTYTDLARAISDATVARLAASDRVTRLAVVGNSAHLRRPRAFRDLKAIGEAAAVDYIVLAQVKRDTSRVRLIAHLIRISDESHLWAETFDRDEFTLDAQAEIAEKIAAAVSTRLLSQASR